MGTERSVCYLRTEGEGERGVTWGNIELKSNYYGFIN